MSQNFKDIYAKVKKEESAKRTKVLKDIGQSILDVGRSDDSDQDPPSPPSRTYTAEELRLFERHSASVKHMQQVMFYPLCKDYKNFSGDPKTWLLPTRATRRGHADGGKEVSDTGLEYFYARLGMKRAISVAYDPDKNKYIYNTLRQGIETSTSKKKSKFWSNDLSGDAYYTKTHKEVSNEITNIQEFNTFEEVRDKFAKDMAYALYHAPTEAVEQSAKHVVAQAKAFGLKKIFALTMAGGLLYACSGDAAELDAQIPTMDNHEISIGYD